MESNPVYDPLPEDSATVAALKAIQQKAHENKISIRKMLKRAGLHRSTFYNLLAGRSKDIWLSTYLRMVAALEELIKEKQNAENR